MPHRPAIFITGCSSGFGLDPVSIHNAIEAAAPIDALVNNAGIGFLNALEGTPMQTAREIFETNTLGTMVMTQAVLPQFRQRRAGVIVNPCPPARMSPPGRCLAGPDQATVACVILNALTAGPAIP